MTVYEHLEKIGILINIYRIFPRIALFWLMYVGTKVFCWSLDVFNTKEATITQIEWFVAGTLFMIITGFTVYMRTGPSQK